MEGNVNVLESGVHELNCELADYDKMIIDELIEEFFADDLVDDAKEPSWTQKLYGDIFGCYDCAPRLNERAEGVLTKAFERLLPREEMCVLSYYRDGKTIDKIANEFGVTADEIDRILHTALRRLRRPVNTDWIRRQGISEGQDESTYGLLTDELIGAARQLIIERGARKDDITAQFFSRGLEIDDRFSTQLINYLEDIL
ncbi:MAG: hypothetical protein J1G38_02055 [Clostridiales bacterium]|nr:hypothetical protein [Clostridiales bacterium]